MSLTGTIKNGVVVLDNGYHLPEGTSVEVNTKVEATKTPEADKPTLLSLLELAGIVDDLPADMAQNHDHYLHGAPKQ